MAKQTLADTVDPSEIVLSNEEQNQPNIMITDDIGIIGGYGDYALVEKKIAYKTGKAEDGDNVGKVIQYTRWDDIGYFATIFDCVKAYCKYRNLTKVKELEKVKDFKVIEQIFIDTNETVTKFLNNYSNMTDANSNALSLIDTINELKRKTDEINKVLSEADDLRELIKSKRQIIIKETEPKKHRLKESEM